MRTRRTLLRLLSIPALIGVSAFAVSPLDHAAAADAPNPRAPARASRESSGLPNVELRSVKLPIAPPDSKLSNPVDLLLATHLKSQGIDFSRTVADRVFARRVFLDL